MDVGGCRWGFSVYKIPESERILWWEIWHRCRKAPALKQQQNIAVFCGWVKLSRAIYTKIYIYIYIVAHWLLEDRPSRPFSMVASTKSYFFFHGAILTWPSTIFAWHYCPTFWHPLNTQPSQEIIVQPTLCGGKPIVEQSFESLFGWCLRVVVFSSHLHPFLLSKSADWTPNLNILLMEEILHHQKMYKAL